MPWLASRLNMEHRRECGMKDDSWDFSLHNWSSKEVSGKIYHFQSNFYYLKSFLQAHERIKNEKAEKGKSSQDCRPRAVSKISMLKNIWEPMITNVSETRTFVNE